MSFSESQWAVFGRTMMLFSGFVLLSFPLYAREDFIHTFMKLWVMCFGVACICAFFARGKP
jgi:hypothetical protein